MQNKETVFIVSLADIGLNDPSAGFVPQDTFACRTVKTPSDAYDLAVSLLPHVVDELKANGTKVVGGRLIQFIVTECHTASEVYDAMMQAEYFRREAIEQYELELELEFLELNKE